MKTILTITIICLCSAAAYSQQSDTDVFIDRVIAIAQGAEGLSRLPEVKGRYFRADCIGFVTWVYYKAGLDLQKAYGQGRGGVSSLYDGLSQRRLIFSDTLAKPGDIIFFDNTYDVNRNGTWDDPLSHIAIVTAIEKHNTMEYYHFGSGRVEREKMNLTYPNTHAFKQDNGKLYIINSYLRRNRGEGYERKQYVASSFYRCFARLPVKVKPD